MNTHRLIIAALCCLGGMLTGCALHSPAPAAPGAAVRPSAAPQAREMPESAAFYFLASLKERQAGNADKAILLVRNAIERDPDSAYLRRELATLYLQNKEEERALAVVEELLLRSPDDVRGLILYGGIKQLRKDPRGAIEAYEKAVRLDPSQEKVFSLLAGMYLEADDLASAERTLAELNARFPRSYAGSFLTGRLHLARNDLPAAEKAFTRCAQIDPDNLDPLFELLKIYREQGRKTDIAAVIETILELDPENSRAALELALFHRRSGQNAEAEALLLRLGERSRTEFEVVLNLIQGYVEPKKSDEALYLIRGMLQAAPESSDLNHLKGFTLFGQKHYGEALEAFRKVAPESRFHQDAVVHMAFILQEQGSTAEALQQLESAIQRNPANPELHYYLGTILEEAGRYDEAAAALVQATQKAPDNANFLFRLGIVYDKQKNKPASIETMRRVIALDPKNANALNYLGYTYAEMGENLDEAEQLILEALRHKPNDGYITDSLGWVYYQKGDYRRALEHLKRAHELVPDDPTIMEHLGDAYLKLGDKANALKFYQRALAKKDKDKEELQLKIRQLKGGGS
ncbi:MAG: tetratricopeptide repeat protein [Desulfobacterales bacterium]|jgi:tetratricopeptide (TPR) repeat protein|nr:tetratricopeptide repeat protein [Desulfobacterales bacterium]